MNYAQAQEIVQSYTRGRPSKKLIEARQIIKEYEEKAKNEYNKTKEIYTKLKNEEKRLYDKQIREINTMLKNNELSEREHKKIEEFLTDKKKQNDITYKKASNIHISGQFKDMYKSYQFVYDDEKVYENLDLLFYRISKDILYGEDALIKRFNNKLSNKTYYIQFKAIVDYFKPTQDAEAEVYVQTKPRRLLSGMKRNSSIKDMLFNELKNIIFENETRDSGLIVTRVNRIYISICETNTIKVRGYIETPKWLQNKKMTINIKNTDEKCFYYAVALGMLRNKGVDITHIRKHTDKPGIVKRT